MIVDVLKSVYGKGNQKQWYCEKRVALIAALFMVFGASPVRAQEPTATILSLEGRVVILDQQRVARTGKVGSLLSEGDEMITGEEASVVLQLTEGSEITFGEKTHVNMALLAQHPETRARTSRLKLWWGRVRSRLSDGHQVPGSAFSFETPNALAGVKFSKPDTEIRFEPSAAITTAYAHRFGIHLTNLATGVSATVSEGQKGIVQGDLLLVTDRTICFEQGGADFDEQALQQLQLLAERLQAQPAQRILLEGHADNVGTDAANLRISQQRAEAVKRVLVEQYGIDPALIEIRAFGAARPISSNDTEEGRAKNRRVEVYYRF